MECKNNKKEESNLMKQLTLQAAFGIKKGGWPKRASLPTDLIQKKAPKRHVASQHKERKTAPAIAKTTSKVKARWTSWGTGKNLDTLKAWLLTSGRIRLADTLIPMENLSVCFNCAILFLSHILPFVNM
jgi:hypothetical protein